MVPVTKQSFSESLYGQVASAKNLISILFFRVIQFFKPNIALSIEVVYLRLTNLILSAEYEQQKEKVKALLDVEHLQKKVDKQADRVAHLELQVEFYKILSEQAMPDSTLELHKMQAEENRKTILDAREALKQIRGQLCVAG